MYEYRKKAGGHVDAAIINAGGIRASISAGNVTQGDVLTSFPFMNAIVDLTWTGRQLLDIFEGIVSKWSTLSHHETTSFIQVSKHIKFSWNESNANQTKLISFEINGQQVDVSKNYTLVSRGCCGKREGNSDLQHDIGCLGLYGHWWRLPMESPNRLRDARVSSRSPYPYVTTERAISTLDVVLSSYLMAHSSINASIEGRITNSTQTQQQIPLSANTTGSGNGESSSMRLGSFTAYLLMAGTGLASLL